MLGILMQSLRSNLQKFFVSQFEEVVHPLKAEASTIKLWLARMANHLERVEPPNKDPFIADMADLFGPCSLVRHVSAPSFLTACTPIRDLMVPDEKLITKETPASRDLPVTNAADVMPTSMKQNEQL